MENIDFKKIIEKTDSSILVVNCDDKIIYANPYFCSLVNLETKDVCGKDITEFIPAKQNEVNIKEYNYKITKYEDTIYTYYYLTLLDSQMEKIYSDFISTVSHELRTPLTSIRGFADTMLMSFDKLDKQQLQKFMTIIKDQSNRLIKLVENLLSISKIQVQQNNLIFKSVNPKAQLEKILEILKAQYPTHPFELKCKENISNILVDENKFQQVMINLLDNAAKYSYENGSISVIVENAQKDNFISIKVKDHGVGIEPNNLSRIFEKFTRIENHLTRKTQGSGLGLYIVKSLIEKMGGQIFVESSTELPNSGSVFDVIFPAVTYTSQSKKVLEDK